MIGLLYSLKELKKEYDDKKNVKVDYDKSVENEKTFTCPHCKKRPKLVSFFILKYSIIKGLFNLFKWSNSI